MGTGPFAVPSFDAVRRLGKHTISLVVTRPSTQNESRSKEAVTNPVRDWATANGFQIFDPKSINDPAAIETVKAEQADLFIVCDYGQILSAEALSASKLGGINLHGSLLPRHRGAAPVQWSILAGDRSTGATIIHMTPKLDGGPILTQFQTEIGIHENAYELEGRLSRLGVDITLEAVSILEKKKNLEECVGLGKPQNPAAVTRAPRFQKNDGQVDFQVSAVLIDRLVRGLQPWPGVFGKIVIQEEAKSDREVRVAIESGMALDSRLFLVSSQLKAGTVLRFDEFSKLFPGIDLGQVDSVRPLTDSAFVSTGEGWFAIHSLKPAGKRSMVGKEFLTGVPKTSKVLFDLPETTDESLLLRKLLR